VINTSQQRLKRMKHLIAAAMIVAMNMPAIAHANWLWPTLDEKVRQECSRVYRDYKDRNGKIKWHGYIRPHVIVDEQYNCFYNKPPYCNNKSYYCPMDMLAPTYPFYPD
jgi:hypothetical protein